MKESYVEGLATHDGPESCGIAREGVASGEVQKLEIRMAPARELPKGESACTTIVMRVIRVMRFLESVGRHSRLLRQEDARGDRRAHRSPRNKTTFAPRHLG